MTNLHLGQRLVSIYAMVDEKGEPQGLIIVSPFSNEASKEILQTALRYVEQGKVVNRVVNIRSPEDAIQILKEE